MGIIKKEEKQELTTTNKNEVNNGNGFQEVEVNVDKALADWEAYQRITQEILDDSDYQYYESKNKKTGKMEVHRFKKKSAWRKYMRAFNISSEIIDKHIERTKNGGVLWAEFTMRAIRPDGVYTDNIGFCSKQEKNHWTKPNHDIPSTAMTRALNRAVSDLIGAGEVSAEEMEKTGKKISAEQASKLKKEEKKKPIIDAEFKKQ